MGTIVDDKERAVEITSHMLAACIHHALATKRMTVAELKEIITDWDPGLIDSMLGGTNADRINCRHMADVAYVLGFDWSFQVRPAPQPEPEQKAA